jgi:hypothetical protein
LSGSFGGSGLAGGGGGAVANETVGQHVSFIPSIRTHESVSNHLRTPPTRFKAARLPGSAVYKASTSLVQFIG